MKGENALLVVITIIAVLLIWMAEDWDPTPCPKGERPTVEGVCVPDGSWQWE